METPERLNFTRIFLWLIAALAVVLVAILFVTGYIPAKWRAWHSKTDVPPIVLIPTAVPTATPTAIPTSAPTPTFEPYKPTPSPVQGGNGLPHTGPGLNVLGVVVAGLVMGMGVYYFSAKKHLKKALRQVSAL